MTEPKSLISQVSNLNPLSILNPQQALATMKLTDYETRLQFWSLDYIERELAKDIIDK